MNYQDPANRFPILVNADGRATRHQYAYTETEDGDDGITLRRYFRCSVTGAIRVYGADDGDTVN